MAISFHIIIFSKLPRRDHSGFKIKSQLGGSGEVCFADPYWKKPTVVYPLIGKKCAQAIEGLAPSSGWVLITQPDALQFVLMFDEMQNALLDHACQVNLCVYNIQNLQ